MTQAQISDKGQLTVPAPMRKKLGLKPKSRVDIELQGNALIVKPVRSVLELSGAIHEYARGKPTDSEAIRDATERAIAEEVVNEDRA